MEIIERLQAAGFTALFVGGCVRDQMLSRQLKDLDIATSATPPEVARLFPGAVPVGAHFGVMLIEGVEVATFRSDGAYSDGRRPDEVRFETDPRADASRRDFTINAMFFDPVSREFRDYFDGHGDLRRKLIRCVGDPARRFAEDHLRMLRAVRFAARLDFEIEEETHKAIVEAAATIRSVSAERVRDELNRILTEGGARRGFELLDETGLLVHVLPEISAMKGVEQPPQYHPEGDVWTHTLIMLGLMREPSVPLAWGVLLHDVGKPATFERAPDRIRFSGHEKVGAAMARDILNRLKFSNDEVREIEALVANHMRFKDVPRMKPSTLKRFLRLDGFERLLELHRIDATSSGGKLENYGLVQSALAAMGPEVLRPPRLVNGHDLIQLGFVPGPLLSDLLREVEDAQLDGRIATREEALELVSAKLPRPDEA